MAKATGSVKNTKSELTAFEQELVKAVKKVKEFKLSCEANICVIVFSKQDIIYNLDNIKLSDFSSNIWKVFWNIANDIIINEDKKSLDEITIGLYLEKHPKLKEKYEEYGGFETITKAKEYVKIENLDGYVNELKKWNVVLELLKMKFPVYNDLSRFSDLSADEIYNEWETKINHIFLNVDGNVTSHNLCENINNLIDKLNEGNSVGLPLYNSPILNKEIGGNLESHITMLGALSGMGKTTVTIELIFPQIIKYDEKLVVIINEEDVEKFRKELIIWVANNIFNASIQKYVLRDGKFSPEHLDILRKCANWIEEKKDKKNITIIPLQKYTTTQAIKIIKKYASMGVKYFVLDTFKSGNGQNTDKIWIEMTKDSVDLYDTIKKTGKNVHLWMTYQLGKSSTKQRLYNNDNIGLAKNIVDVASTNLMIRKPFEDEFEGGKNELKCYKLEGKKGLTKIPFKLDTKKHYTIIFITKNRFGATNEFQIVCENDLSRNVYKEIGICNVPMDW